MIPDRHSERSAFRPHLMLALSVAMCISTVTYTAYAAPPQAITLQGTILTPSGLPLETASVGFTVEIRSPGAENCLLYRETHTLNMTNSGGAFSLPIGTGVRAGGGFQETSALSAVFDNDSADITGLTCQTGSNYDPASGDTRKVSITFDDGTGPQNLNQTLSVQSVPFALHAQSTNTLGPYGALDFLVLNPLSGLTQTNLDLVFASNANVTELLALINGTSTLFAKSAGAQTFSGAVTLSSPGTALSVTNNAFIGGTTTIGGVTSITNTTASTSSTTGALTINGGIGVAENLNAGGAVNAATTLSAGTSLMTPIIYGSSAASGTLTLQSTSNTTKGNILMNPDGGNVGIGTTSPGSKLEVTSSSTATASGTVDGVKYSMTHAPTAMSFADIIGVETTATYAATSLGFSSVTGQKTTATSTSGVNLTTLNGAVITTSNTNYQTNTATGINNTVINSANTGSGVVANANGIISSVQNTGTGWISNAKGGHFEVLAPSGSISTGYGVYIGTIAGITKYSLFASDAAAPSYFAGNVGIGVTGPTSKLQVAGDITPDTTATKNLGSGSLRWNNIYLSNAPDVSSDARLKKDVQNSDLGLDFINSLRPVSWTWKDANQGTTQHYGVIAQETELAIAKAKGQDSSNVIVTHNEEADSYSVRYTELISPLIKAFQELYAKVMGHDEKIQAQGREIASKADKTEVDQLKADNVAKDKKIKELEQRLEQIEKSLKSK